MRLRRKVALVTGAGTGIGQEVADLTGCGRGASDGNLAGLMTEARG